MRYIFVSVLFDYCVCGSATIKKRIEKNSRFRLIAIDKIQLHSTMFDYEWV